MECDWLYDTATRKPVAESMPEVYWLDGACYIDAPRLDRMVGVPPVSGDWELCRTHGAHNSDGVFEPCENADDDTLFGWAAEFGWRVCGWTAVGDLDDPDGPDVGWAFIGRA